MSNDKITQAEAADLDALDGHQAVPKTGIIHSFWFPSAVLLFAAVLYFSPYLNFTKIIMGSDDGPRGWHSVGNYGLEGESFFFKWSPYNGGTPLLERRFGRFINPGQIFHIFLKKYKARVFEYILWTFIGGFFMYCFLRELKISRGVSLLCSLGFMFAPALQSYIFGGHFARMEVVALMPGVMLFTHRMVMKASLVSLAILPALLALSIYSMHLQLAYFVFVGMGIYFALMMIHKAKTKEVTIREGSKRTVYFSVALVIGLLINSMNTFPTLHHTEGLYLCGFMVLPPRGNFVLVPT
jgi:hypothetical protein